jgi:hypothetical protein
MLTPLFVFADGNSIEKYVKQYKLEDLTKVLQHFKPTYFTLHMITCNILLAFILTIFDA